MLAGEKLLIIWMFKDTETMIIKIQMYDMAQSCFFKASEFNETEYFV